ncbi:MAG: SCP2 sterol-binding domain-containing protein [Chloroflexi bacterium]|nr:SCP2 sterol-binding domain-containing protein [Chloroflexota bacterium]
MNSTDVTQALEALPDLVDPQKLAGVNTVAHFELSGEGGGDWILTIVDGRLSVAQGAPSSPDLTFRMEASDLQAMLSGSLNPIAAFMQGKIKVVGDMMVAMRLQALFT